MRLKLSSATAAALGLCLAVGAASAEDNGGLDSHKLTIKSYIDFAELVNGYNYYAPSGTDPNITMLPINRMNVTAIQDYVSGGFDLSVGLSGLVWWPYGGGTTDITEKIMSVKPMIPVARARWQFGDPKETSSSFMLGTFNYKYNPDAKDLGEYLYRDGTYPGYLWSTEGWLLMNRASNYSFGGLYTLSNFGGALKHNFSLFMETQFAPIGAFSPGYDLGATTKWLDFGGGVVLNHYIDFKPSQETPTDPQNTLVDVNDTAAHKHFIGTLADPNLPSATAGDTVILHRWTFKGVKTMGRAALKLGNLLPDDMRSPEDLRVFAEVAVLGWSNQPIYYTKRSERMPIMFGLNVPTFKALDVLTLQGEYYKSPYNDIDLLNSSSLPLPQTTETDSVHADDWKWAVYAKKTVNKAITVYGQAASDHFRLSDAHFKASSVPLTHRYKDWYFVLRMEFNLR